MARKITISFKETSKDIDLYNYIKGLDDKSSEIKNILREAFKNKLSKEEKQIKNTRSENVNVRDF